MKGIYRAAYAFLALFVTTAVMGQDLVTRTFKDTRVINAHSIETVPKRKLDFRVAHRFGDFAGTRGGWNTFYGLESAQDIMIGFEYGVSDVITASFYRTKGSGALRQLLNGGLKAKILKQKVDATPVSITLVGLATISTMSKSDDKTLPNFFQSVSQRMAYHSQILVARKFSDRFSLQLSGGFTHRNLVTFGDENDIISIGFASRIQLNRVFGLILDGTYLLSDIRNSDNGYYMPLGVGIEIETGGHVFQINFTNAGGIAETDYIPYTQSSWSDGGYRLGFTISRLFNL